MGAKGRRARRARDPLRNPVPAAYKLVLPRSCPNCKEELSALDAFCPACGTVLGEEE